MLQHLKKKPFFPLSLKRVAREEHGYMMGKIEFTMTVTPI